MRIELNIEKKYAFMIIALFSALTGMLVVYAYGGNTPTSVGHSIGELDKPASCLAGQFLQWTASGWTCANGGSVTATVPASQTGSLSYTTSACAGEISLGNHKFCALTSAISRGNDDNNANGCEVYQTGSEWRLRAINRGQETSTGLCNEMRCKAACID